MTLTLEQQRLVRSVRPRVAALSRHFARKWPSITADDLEAEGNLAVAETVLRYDAAQGANFDAFAYPRYRGAMIDYARRTLRDLPRFTHAVSAIERRDEGGAINAPDVMGELLNDVPAASEVLHSLRMQATVMTAGLLGTHGDDSESEWINHMGAQIARQEIVKGLAAVSPEYSSFIRAFYFESRTLDEIAKQRGVSKRTVQRIHDYAKGLLHAWLVSAGVAESDRANP
jgi:RNA polymerase sigma factor (sigma-70 family)